MYHRITATRRCQARWRLHRHLNSIALFLLVLCLILLAINVRELRLMHEAPVSTEPYYHAPTLPAAAAAADRRRSAPVVWIYGKRLETGHLKHVFDVFERLGYVIGNETSDWSVLWSHDFPFNIHHDRLHALKPHQKVNHFPGIGALTNKPNFAESQLDVIPRAFRLPEQRDIFLLYAKYHPEKTWVQKSITHRGISVIGSGFFAKISEFFDAAVNKFIQCKSFQNESRGSIMIPSDAISATSLRPMVVQEYIDNPFLIDGRRFDIGLYVTITSVDPLRAYVFQGEWLVRFCSKEYHPFDSRDVDKYVISDDYTPLWQIPSLAKYYNDLDGTRREALLAYIRSVGRDPDLLNKRLEEAIRQVLYEKDSAFNSATKEFPVRNFFEMVRFDFIVTENFQIYLLEVNMSPNLSSGHFVQNQLMYEQVIYSTLSLVGLAANSANVDSSHVDSSTGVDMEVSSRDLRVHLDVCLSSVCSQSAAVRCSERKQTCQLCKNCLSSEDETMLMSAYSEHIRRGKWRRVVPQSFPDPETARKWNRTSSSLTAKNHLLFEWYRGKCMQNADWC